MNIVRVLEIAVLAVGILLFITQITIPLYRGRPIFPWFRREGKLLSEVEDLRQQKVEQELQDIINKAKSGLKHQPKKGSK
jgi:hypothetical protein